VSFGKEFVSCSCFCIAPLLSKLTKIPLLLTVALMVLWIWQQWNLAVDQWENLGDAHFYAHCADHFNETGINRWFEIFPIVLSKGSGTEMSYARLAHPFIVSKLIAIGFLPPIATLLSCLLAFVAMMCSVGFWIWRSSGIRFAVLSMVVVLFFPKVVSFASSGGTEPLSIFFLVNSLGILMLSQNKIKFWWLLLAISMVGAWVRPHNQIFFYALFIPAIVQAKEQRALRLFGWIAAVVFFHGFSQLYVVDFPLQFSYLFSFLCGTNAYPGHSMYRIYFSEGLNFEHLWNQRDEIIAKIDKAVYLLKLYWTGWLPQLALMFTAILFRAPSWVLSPLMLLFSVIMVLASMGHLVPRFWEMLQPVAWVFFIKYSFEAKYTGLFLLKGNNAFSWMAMLLMLLLCVQGWSYNQLRHLHLNPVPEEMIKSMASENWVACDDPAKLIDLWKKTILLCPDDLKMLNKIDAEVQPINEIVFTPALKDGELAKWIELNQDELQKSWLRKDYDQWILFSRQQKH